MQLHKIWIKQCEAARGIEDVFGTQRVANEILLIKRTKEWLLERSDS